MLSAATLAAQDTPSELADIRDPVNFVPWLVVGGVVLALVLVAAVVYWILRRRAAKKGLVATEPPIPPAIWAREQFDRLAADSARLDDKHFTSGVADVLRAYLERAFKVPAPERTTEEFLQLIGDHPIFEGQLRATLDDFLRRSDLVKFARQSLAAEQREPMLREARAVVDEAEKLNVPGPDETSEAAGPKGAPTA